MGKQFGFRVEGIEIASVLNAMLQRWEKRSGMGLQALSGALLRSYDWASKVWECKLHFHADCVAPLTKLTGDDALIEALARQCGGTFVRDPQPDPLDQTCIRAVLQHTAAVADQYLAAVEDGTVDQREAVDVLRVTDSAIKTLHEFRGTVAHNAKANGAAGVRVNARM